MTNYIGGPGVALPAPAPLYPTQIGSPAIPFTNGQNLIDLWAGQTLTIPAGRFWVHPGRYSMVQVKDPVTTIWRTLPVYQAFGGYVDSDGQNYRIANLTGCVIGALVTSGGLGYTAATAPTVTTSANNNATFVAIVGGCISTSVTVGTAGSGYTLIPTVLFGAPPAPGVQATGVAVLSGSTIGSITVNNQGAGYTSAPIITIVPNPQDPTLGSITAAAATCTTSGTGTVTAVLCTFHGTPTTAVPTLVFSAGTAAATAIMCYTASAYTVGSTGSGYATPVEITTINSGTAGLSVILNPAIQTGLMIERPARIIGAISSGTLSATGQAVVDGGLFEAVPTAIMVGAPVGSGAALATATISVSGTTDTVFITPL